MERILKKCFGIALSIVGAMVGVGLASGREIVSFFARFGFISILFCFISGIVIFLLCFTIFEIERKIKNNHKNSVNYANLKNRKNHENSIKNVKSIQICEKKYKNIDIFKIILFVCQLSLCGAMFAGLFSIFNYFSIGKVLSIVLMICVFVVSYLILSRAKTMVFSFNFVLVLALLVFIFIVFAVKLFNSRYEILSETRFKWFSIVMPFLYAGMNVLTVYPLLIESFRFVKNKKEEILISVLTGLFVFILLTLVCLFVLLFGGNGISDDMIMFSILESGGVFVKTIYAVILMFCIFTTLLSTAYGASSILKIDNVKLKTFCCLAVSLLLGFIGFSNIVNFIYPALGFVCILFVFVKFIGCKKSVWLFNLFMFCK